MPEHPHTGRARRAGAVGAAIAAGLALLAAAPGAPKAPVVSVAPAADVNPYEAPGVTLTQVGETAPEFTVKTLSGDTIDVSALKGRVLAVNFWATWCGPCQQELPRLDREVWQPFRSRGLALVAIARKQSESEIRAWGKKYRLTIPLAADPGNAIYPKFATEGIPRTYLIGADGRILYQTVGYSPDDIDRIRTLVGRELARHPGPRS